MSETVPTVAPARPWWLLLFALAIVELVGSVVVRARVPAASDWDRAAASLAAQYRDGDAIVAAPAWIDPELRAALGRAMGERFDLDVAGAPGLDGAGRAWAVTIRGHAAPIGIDGATLGSVEQVGRIRLERWDLPPATTLYDFTRSLEEASVRRGTTECRSTRGRSSGGGLGAGPVLGPDRFTCGGETIARTVIEDLDFAARHCIAQRPSATAPVAVTFSSVPLGDRLVLWAGLHWVDERHHIEPEHVDVPVTLRAAIGERELASFVHHDGDGWARSVVTIPDDLRNTTADLTFTVEGRGNPSYCWTGRSIRDGESEVEAFARAEGTP